MIGLSPPGGDKDWTEETRKGMIKLVMASSPIYMKIISYKGEKLMVDLIRRPGDDCLHGPAHESVRDMLVYYNLARFVTD